MTELVELVAPRLHDVWLQRALENNPENVPPDLNVPFEHLSEQDAEYYRVEATAAIAATLEAMLPAGYEFLTANGEPICKFITAFAKANGIPLKDPAP